MKNELVSFDGGMNNVVAPHMIPIGSAVYISDADISTGELASAKIPEVEDSLPYGGSRSIYYKAKDEVVSSEEDRFYVEWTGFLYWSNFVGDGSGKLQRYDGVTVVDIGGHVPPTGSPTVDVDGSGLLNGDYSYCYTYEYEDVFESAPSDIAVLTPVLNNKVKITFSDTPPVAPAPTHRIIYRAGGLNPTFNQIEKIPVSQTEYIDNTSDFNISRKELTTGNNDAPPADIDMLVESSGTLFGAVGSRVHFSKEGQPEYWSNYNFVDLPTKVTGLGVIGDAIVAFTEENMFIIHGKNIKTISIQKLPFQFGCTSKRTVQNLKGRLVWLTTMEQHDLICSYDGGNVDILNRTNLTVYRATISRFTYEYFTDETYADIDFEILGSIAIGRKYMLFLTDRTVVVDFETGVKVYYMKETVLGAFEYHNTMIVSMEDETSTKKNYKYAPSFAQRRNLKYSTGDYSGGSLIEAKAYRKINVNAEGKWGISVTVDGKNVFTFDYTNGQTILLPAGITGRLISFSISSDGSSKIKAIQYEYDVLKDGFRQIAIP